MATETTVNAQLIKYDASGNQTIINPNTLAQDITITANTNKSSITNLQSLITALGSLAFVSKSIVTTVESCTSGVLVDGSVVVSLSKDITTLKTTTENIMDLIGEMTGASSDSDGTGGLVPPPVSGEENYYLRGDGTWVSIT